MQASWEEIVESSIKSFASTSEDERSRSERSESRSSAKQYIAYFEARSKNGNSGGASINSDGEYEKEAGQEITTTSRSLPIINEACSFKQQSHRETVFESYDSDSSAQGADIHRLQERYPNLVETDTDSNDLSSDPESDDLRQRLSNRLQRGNVGFQQNEEGDIQTPLVFGGGGDPSNTLDLLGDPGNETGVLGYVFESESSGSVANNNLSYSVVDGFGTQTDVRQASSAQEELINDDNPYPFLYPYDHGSSKVGGHDRVEESLGSRNKEQLNRSQKMKIRVLAALVILVFIVVIVLATTLPRDRNVPVNFEGSVGASSSSGPTSSPTPVDPGSNLRSLILSTGITAEEDLANEESAQSLSFQWLLQSETSGMPRWRILQRFAMVSFYYSTGGPSWLRQDGWLSNEPECEWFLRSSQPCRGGKLVHLSLVLNGLGGTLPQEIGLVTSLERIILGAGAKDVADIGGPIPLTLRGCTNLELLHMQHQSLTGQLEDNLIRSWPNLASLDLAGNKLGGTLPPSLGNLAMLNRVSLAENVFTGTIPASYGSIRGTLLELRRNQLKGSFPSGTLSDMRWLGLESNQLTGLPHVIAAPRLRSLRASNNSIEGTLPEFQALWSARSMEEIRVSGNSFSGSIPGSWANFSGLETIDLSSNRLVGIVPSWLTSLPDLAVLRLEGNSFSSLTCPTAGITNGWSADCGVGQDGNVEILCTCCGVCCFDGDACK